MTRFEAYMKERERKKTYQEIIQSAYNTKYEKETPEFNQVKVDPYIEQFVNEEIRKSMEQKQQHN